jgi:phosphoglucosamine mutase
MIMGKYFGTDGFRGEANCNLTADHAFRVGRFLGWYYTELHRRNGILEPDGSVSPARVVIGKDTRRSSYMFEYSLVGGLTASGADAYLLHVTTTPSVAYVARVDEFDCGIMISASHNPYYDNGIKLINRNGEKMDEDTIALVEAYLDGNLHVFDEDYPELPYATRDRVGCTVDYVSGRNRYIGYLISLGMYSFRGIKVALDCANGSAWNVAKAVFDALGATTYVINAEPNGLNINKDAGSTHIEHLQKFVVEKGCNVGFAYDGDADRCLCVDEKGNVLTGDHILYIYAKYMKDRSKLLTNTVVTTVMSNFGLYKALDDEGISYAKTAVGDKYVYEYMTQHGCRLGGEQSGHIIFSKYASTGDGILTSLKMMEVMLAKKTTMSELVKDLVIYPQVLKNVRVADKAAAQADPKVQAAVQSVADALGDSGRILVRESGTEPVIRVMVEAGSKELCQTYVDQVVDVIHAQGHCV